MNNKKTVVGIILISIGLLIGLNTFEILPGQLTVFLLSLGFLAAYFFFKRTLGFLIPGSVLLAAAVFATFEEVYHIDELYFMMLLGLVFFGVFLIHSARIPGASWGEKFWPLFPAVGLILIGGLVMAVNNGILNFDLKYLDLITPAILVAIGIIMVVRNRRAASR